MERMFDTSVFDRHTLRNGVRVYRQRSPIKVSKAGVLILGFPNCGSASDPINRPGLNHFFEHMPFRGTNAFPNKVALIAPIEAKGGEINAATGQTRVNYHITLPEAHYPMAMDVLYEMAFLANIGEQETISERGVIHSERQKYAGDSTRNAWRVLFREIFGPHPYNHLPIGELDVIDSVTAEELRVIQKNNYHAGNLTIFCGGSFADRPDMQERLEEKFGGLPLRTPITLPDAALLPIGKSGEVDVHEPLLSRDYLGVAYPLKPTTSWDQVLFELLAEALSGGMASPLVLKLREELRLTYESGPVFLQRFHDIWIFMGIFPVPADSFNLVLTTFIEELRKLEIPRVLAAIETVRCRRECEFSAPVTATLAAARNFSITPENYSESYYDTIVDDIAPEEILVLRDRILEMDPFVCRIRK